MITASKASAEPSPLQAREAAGHKSQELIVDLNQCSSRPDRSPYVTIDRELRDTQVNLSALGPHAFALNELKHNTRE